MKNDYLLFADLALFAMAALGAFIVRFEWAFLDHWPEFRAFLAAALVVKPVTFSLLGMYRRYWQHASIQDLGAIIVAVSVASAAMAVFVTLGYGLFFASFSGVVIFADWVMTVMAAGGLRAAIRIRHDHAVSRRARGAARPAVFRRILIVGAGEAGTMVAREMRRSPQLGMRPIGFLDDDPGKWGQQVMGLPVIGPTKLLPETAAAHLVDLVIIAIPSAGGAAIRTVLELCTAAGVKSQTVPGVYELLDGRATVSRLRNVDITDLLRRSPVDGQTNAAAFVRGHVVLITGGGGSIGAELGRQIAAAAPERLVILGHGENSIFEAHARLRQAVPACRIAIVVADIRDHARLAQVFDQVKPSIVFHAAAHKHVPLMEEQPEEAVTNNIVGTRNLVREAVRTGVERLVLISTDKAVVPVSIMGATKRIAEAIVRQAARATGRAFVAVRFGNVLGSRGSVVHTFKQQIDRGGPITITHPDMARFFMTIPEAVHLVLHATGEGKAGDLFMLDMGEPVKIVQLARDLVRLSGLDEHEIAIEFTGIRPGEKLHEALFDEGTQVAATSHPDVFRLEGGDPSLEVDLQTVVSRLEDAARRGDRTAIARILADAIPGFEPDARSAEPLVS